MEPRVPQPQQAPPVTAHNLQPQYDPSAQFQPMPGNPPPKKRGLNIGLLIGSLLGGLLVVGAIFWAVTTLGGASKEDLQRAYGSAQTLEDKLGTTSFDLRNLGSVSGATEAEAKSDSDKAKQSLADYKKADQEFKNEKGLRDADAAKAYKDYRTKADKYLAFAETYTTSAATLLPVFAKCEDSVKDALGSNSGAVAIDSLDSCATELGNLKGLNDTDVAGLRDAAAGAFGEYKDALSQLLATPANDLAKRSALRNQILDAQKESTKKIRDIQTNIEKRYNDANPREELQKITDILREKTTKE